MTERSDEDFVRECRSGDRKAYDALVERYQRTIYNVAVRMVRDRDDAADVTQSVFVKAYEGLAKFDDRFKFFSWLYRIAVNESLNLLNQRKRFEGLDGVDIAETPDEGLDDETIERESGVQSALMMLKSDQRAIIVLKHMQGLSYDEIGQIMDLPVKRVKSRLFSARQALRDHLRKKGVG